MKSLNADMKAIYQNLKILQNDACKATDLSATQVSADHLLLELKITLISYLFPNSFSS